MVKEGDHVWGICVNPSHFRAGTLPKSLTLHSVRGPLTSNFIKKEGFNSTKNDSLPLGDPVCFVVHKNDLGHTFVRKPPPNVHIITCAQHWETAVTEIQSCGFVASSSLHGIVVADALSIPRLWFQFNDTSTIRTEGNFKYQDYLQSIGHMNARPIRNVTFIEDTTKYSNVLTNPLVLTQSELQAIINQTSDSFPYHLFHT
ncbi:hypothetical protein QTG54_007192 [Skeletonema marinoi]|uniref:Polysaccharide pyruvyl transferase domain-containing protein n=1 Tax=Skeletonema marinoi TaxID=267567 RepID=A0AAD8Y9P2_9STRA|nr:hypothetical protein QTG54_007192 [Skeletonema marinoi]